MAKIVGKIKDIFSRGKICEIHNMDEIEEEEVCHLVTELS